ncbi:hypothetical protein HC931_22605 [Candidatus Gracilibacteria bacterium]|nr:hypothetical protein [Candidatus Gracilibacteria bacterium]NJP22163.1 hypothetical protein [Hydrococcus sp. CRU_1_1]
MKNKTFMPPKERITLSGISWQSDEMLLKEFCNRLCRCPEVNPHLPLTHNRGTLR